MVVLAVVALGAVVLPSGVGSAATVSDSASATVSLDAPGVVSLDGFDSGLGTLTAVEVSLSVEVLVQVCVENTGATSGSLAGGSVSATLAAAFPGGPAATEASAGASVGPTDVAASNGSADCDGGFDQSVGRFPGGVSAGDAAFAQGDGAATQTATLTSAAELAPFIGVGTVAVSFTPTSDSNVVLPAEFDSLVVAQGQLQATVTYTYTPGSGGGGGTGGGGGPTSPPGGDGLPVTGAGSGRIAVVAAIAVLVGGGLVVAARRWRMLPVSDRSGRAFGVIGLLALVASTVPTTTTTQPPPSTTTSEVPDPTTSTTVEDTTTTTTATTTSMPDATTTTTSTPPDTTVPTETSEPSTTSTSSTTTTGPATTTTSSTTTTTLPPDDDDVEVAERLPDTRERRPISFPVVGGGSFGYGWMDCRDDCTRFHKGTDIMAAKLQPLVSPVDGVVERFLDHPTAGTGIVIRGVDGYQYRLYHLNNDNPGTDDGRAPAEWRFGDGLAVGARVEASRLIGFVGDSGNAEHYLPHLHFEIHRPDGRPINPYWSLQRARRDELHCASVGEIDDSWLRVAGVVVSPSGFRPGDDSLCRPEAEPLQLAAAVVGQATAVVPLSGASTTTPVTLDQFDPASGTLERVTITVTLDADAPVAVTNLTAEPKATTVQLAATATATGPGVVALQASAGDAGSQTIAAGASGSFVLAGTGGGQQVITDPAALAQFVGTGTVTFDVTGAVNVDVAGPATWRGTGTLSGAATVSVDYNTDVTPPSTTTPPTTTTPNQPPVANDDTADVTEDAADAAVGNVLANDDDIDGPDQLTVAMVNGDPANVGAAVTGTYGTLEVAADGSYSYSLDNTLDAVQALAAGQQVADTVIYEVSDGAARSAATFTVTVTGANDTPVAEDDAANLTANATSPAVGNVLTNDLDVDSGDVLAVSTVDGGPIGTIAGDFGTLVIGADGAYSYTVDTGNQVVQALAPGEQAADSFDYTATDGNDDSAPATLTITITGVNDAPVANDDTVTITEDRTDPVTGNVLANDVDVDTGDAPTVATVDGDPAKVSTDATGVLLPGDHGFVSIFADGEFIYTVDRTDADVQALAPGEQLTDSFTYTASDGDATSNEATLTITITGVDDLPVATDDAASVTEDDTAPATGNVVTNDVDVDGPDPLSVAAVEGAAGNVGVVVTGDFGTVTIDSDGDFSYTLDNTLGAVQAIAAEEEVTDTFTYQVTDGANAAQATLTVTITGVNDAPVADDDTVTITEDRTDPVTGNVLANDVDVDTGDAPTVASVDGDPAKVSTDATGVLLPGDHGFVSIFADGDFDYTLSSTDPEVQALAPGEQLTDSFTYTASDGDATSNEATLTITITGVDDPPVAVDDTGTVTEDSAVPVTIDVLANDTDVDGGPIAIDEVTDPDNGSVLVTAGGLSYAPAADYCNTHPTGSPDTFTYSLAPGGDTATVSVTVTCVNDPPTAGDDTYTGANAALANTRLVVGTTTTGPHLALAGSVLDNDTDDTLSSLTAGPATISSTNCAGCNNVTLEADGNFIYDPPAGFTGTDSFTYTLNDNDPAANQTDSGTVTIEVVGPLVWYVDIDAAAPPAGQGGRSHSPFNSLAALNSGTDVDGPGDIIFLGVGTNSYGGGIVLEPNQRLWGEPFGLTVDPDGPRPLTTVLATSPTTPATGNPSVINVDPFGVAVTLANGVDIQRVNAGNTGSTNTGVEGTAITTATIGPDQLIGGNPTAFTLTGAASGDISVAADISSVDGKAIDVRNRTGGTVTFSGAVNSRRNGAGVQLINNAGAAIAFSGPIVINGENTNFTSFSATGGGTITATDATSQVTGFMLSGGIDLRDIAIGAAGITFGTVNSGAGGAGNAISIGSVTGPGTFTVIDGTVAGTSTALAVDTVSANVTIGADLTASTIFGMTGRSVEVHRLVGGAVVDIDGHVTNNAGGINLSDLGSGTVRFDGGITANTGTRPAFIADGGGTIAVTDPPGPTANTLTTTTGVALNVANTTIHADGLTFQSISANGAANGIVLTNTGSQGGLTVTGNSTGLCGGQVTVNALGTPATITAPNGADCTGGTIQSTTGHAIVIDNSAQVSLTRMRILNSGLDGINVNNIDGFALTDSWITDGSGSAQDSGVQVGDFATGTAVNGPISITSSRIGPTQGANVAVGIGSGTSTWSITGSLLTDSQQNSGLNFEVRSGTASATIDGSVFSSQAASGVQMQPAASVAASLAATIQNSTFIDNNGHADLDHAGIGTTTYRLSSNTLRNANTHAVTLSSPGEAGGTFNARLVNNRIGDAGAAGSGSAIGNGVLVAITGGTDANVLIDGNVVRQTPNLRGIAITSRNGSGGTDVTLTNNQVDTDFVATPQNGGLPLASILLESGCFGVCNALRADVRGNSVPAIPPDDVLAAHLVLFENQTSTLQLVDDAPASADCTAELTSQNTGSVAASAGCALIAGPISTPP